MDLPRTSKHKPLTACDNCRKLKIKCHFELNSNCQGCIKRKLDCTFSFLNQRSNSQPSKPRFEQVDSSIQLPPIQSLLNQQENSSSPAIEAMLGLLKFRIFTWNLNPSFINPICSFFHNPPKQTKLTLSSFTDLLLSPTLPPVLHFLLHAISFYTIAPTPHDPTSYLEPIYICLHQLNEDSFYLREGLSLISDYLDPAHLPSFKKLGI